MTIPMKNVKLTTCEVVVSQGLKKRLRSLVKDKSPDNAADVVVGRCEDCGALIYADDVLTPEPELEPEPVLVDEWECLL